MPTLSTTAPFGFEVDPERHLAGFAALGCSQAQFYRNLDHPPDLGFAIAIAARAGMGFDAMHGVFGASIDPSSPDPDHRARCLAIYEGEAMVALELGARRVIVHPASYDRDAPATPREGRVARLASLAEFCRGLADIGARRGITFAIENLPPGVAAGDDATELGACLAALASPHVRMCFDVGHAHLTGDVAASLSRCAPVIDYLHVHDNDGAADQHLFPGATGGTVAWERFAEALRTTGLAAPRMLEVFAPPPLGDRDGVAAVRARLAHWCAL